MEGMRFRLPDETTGTGEVIDLGLWTNIPETPREFEFTREMFLTLRDIPSQFPDLPDEEDEDL